MNPVTEPPAEQRTPKAFVVERLVRRIFPAPWWALLIFGACIACIIKGDFLAAVWAFSAGAWSQAAYEDSSNVKEEQSQPGTGSATQGEK